MKSDNQVLMQTVCGGHDDSPQLWRGNLQKIIATHDLTDQRLQISRIAQDLNMTVLDCAAAMLYLMAAEQDHYPQPSQKLAHAHHVSTLPPSSFLSPNFKLVRYRLDLGSQHRLSLEQLKKVIVEESGVDIKNIFNVRIQDTYTLVDLPDEMPQEIFHHLKTVEINGKKLDIRRVKARPKKHSNRRRRQRRPVTTAAKSAG